MFLWHLGVLKFSDNGNLFSSCCARITLISITGRTDSAFHIKWKVHPLNLLSLGIHCPPFNWWDTWALTTTWIKCNDLSRIIWASLYSQEGSCFCDGPALWGTHLGCACPYDYDLNLQFGREKAYSDQDMWRTEGYAFSVLVSYKISKLGEFLKVSVLHVNTVWPNTKKYH